MPTPRQAGIKEGMAPLGSTSRYKVKFIMATVGIWKNDVEAHCRGQGHDLPDESWARHEDANWGSRQHEKREPGHEEVHGGKGQLALLPSGL
ncbi:hypothetical protein MKX08_005360 [Trichoderma sp. CBMAI-0020]|nr:hypothetical protein MKX08_005360 [Trichoderma sp. CBMAI-0020]WOD45761.1 hypothetical protein [Trichoderma atroviride]